MAFIRKTVHNTSTSQTVIKGEKLTAAEIREKARSLGIDLTPLDLIELTNRLGIRLLCLPMDDETSGSLEASASGWIMKVNALHHPNRQRFTIAHELGHYFTHREIQSEFTDQNFFRNAESTPMEREANNFASELLMPEDEFKEKTALFRGSIEAVANYFKVSTLAVRVRAKKLGMKGHGL